MNRNTRTVDVNQRIRDLRAEIKKLDRERQVSPIEKLTGGYFRITDMCQETLPIAKDFEDGMFKLFDGSYSVAFSFTDMSYHILKESDGKTIFNRYTDLVNSFGNDVTVMVVLVNNYGDQRDFEDTILIKDRADDLDRLRNEYNNMLISKSKEGDNNLEKEQCLVISIKADNDTEAKNKFIRLESEILQGIKRIGSRAKRQDIIARCRMLHDFLSPDSIGELNDEDSFDYRYMKLNHIPITDYICPDGFTFGKKNYFRIGKKYARCLTMNNNYPAFLSDRLFGELATQPFPVVVNLTFTPYDINESFKITRHQISGIESNIQEAQKKATQAGYDPSLINPRIKEAYNNANDIMDQLQNENQKLFATNVSVMHVADTLGQLNTDTQTLMNVARKRLCQLDPLNELQEDAMNQILPFGYKKLAYERTLTSASTSVFIPFTSQEVIQKGGFYYGQNAVSKKIILINRIKNLMNCNGFILGKSGSGKSFAVKREIVNILLNTNDDVIVIDPEREYADLCHGFKGERVEISPKTKTYFNLMAMNKDYAANEGDPITAKSDFMLSVATSVLGEARAGDKSIIDRCVRNVYKDYIEHDFDPEYEPTLVEFQQNLKSQKELQAKEMALGFELFTTGSLNVFAHKTNVDIKNRFVVYDINELGKGLFDIGLLVMLDNVWNRVIENRKKGIRTWVYVDEIYLLFKNIYSAEFLKETFKRIRKYKGACTGISQNVSSLLKSEMACEMIANSEFILLLNQADNDRIQLAEIMKISEQQLSFVTDVEQGEGLIKAGKFIVPFIDKFPKNTELYELMTTDPEDVKKIKEKRELLSVN